LKRIEDIAWGNPQCCESCVGEIDENAFRTLAEDFDLLDTRDMQQSLPERLRFARQLPRRHACGFDSVEREIYVRIFIVDEWPERSSR